MVKLPSDNPMFSEKKRWWLFLVISVICFLLLHVILRFGEAAQRTFAYSNIKELEERGLLSTNVNAVVESKPGKALLTLRVVRDFDGYALWLCFFWAISGILLFFPRRSTVTETRRAT